MSRVVESVAVGAALIGAAVFIPGGFLAVGGLTGASGLASILASAGAGLVLSGIGTLLPQKSTGIATTSRNPIAPWQCIYGRKKVGGVIVYQEEVASNNRILLLVVAVAAHSCEAIESIYFNNKRLPFKTNSQFSDQSNPNGFLQSYTFAQFTLQIETIGRVNDIVSVTFTQDPSAVYANFNGDTIRIENSRDAAGGNSFDGYFPVVQTGPNSFTYACGGPQGPGSGNPGHIVSTYPDYGGTVTVGYYLGNQTQASGIIIGNTAGYWTPACVLQGRTYVALKLTYDKDKYSGLPEISFVVRGKNDILDPRTGKKGYTNNAALCIADYLAHPLWGYNAAYGTQIPTPQLIAAANTCDEQVPLALGGTEPRYTCDGAFDVSVSRAEVIQNLLTSCGGRLVEIGGQFIIQPAGWVTPVGAITVGGCSNAPKMMMSSQGLVPEFFNSPTTSYFPACAGSSRSQFIYALGMLAAYQSSGNANALALAKLALGPIEKVLFRNIPVPLPVTDQNIWSPNWGFDVKQPFLGDGGATIAPTQCFASDFLTPAGWRVLKGQEIQTNGDVYNLAIRLFGQAAAVIDGAYTVANPDPGYGLSPYGDTYGDPPIPAATVNSSYLLSLNAILQMAAIAYEMYFESTPGNILTLINPAYQGGAVPFAVEFLGHPPALSTWIGPYYTGYQSPYAIRQAFPGSGDPRVNLAVSFLAAAQTAFSSQGTSGDTVVFTRTGANPGTVTVPIQIAPNGTALARMSYPGLVPGTDSIVATLPSRSLTSNQAKIAWSAYPKAIAVYGVQVVVEAADGTGVFNGASSPLSTTSVQGLMFNSHPQSIFPGDPHQSGNQANPFVSNAVDSSGGYAGDQVIAVTSSRFNALITGGFSVQAAGNITFSAYVNSRFVIGLNNGATYVSGQQGFGPLTATAQNGYPCLAGNNSGAFVGGNWAQIDFTIHFPAAGLYLFEIDYASGLFSERQFCLLASGAVIPTVQLSAAGGTIATGTAPSGQLQLTPYSGGAAIGTTAQYTLALTGLPYSAPSSGPFAPVYYFQTPPGAQTWGTVGTWGWNGPDPNTAEGYYQYRPLAELCDLIGISAGTEFYYSQAVSVANTFASWIAGKWTTATTGPPNSFPQSGAQTTKQDVHCAALILHAILALDLHSRPTGAGTISSPLLGIINNCYGLFSALYLSSGPMAGTFCLNPTGAQDWSPIWHGELLRSLSMLVTWAGLNGQAAMKAQAIVWINGLVNFALNEVVVVNPNLGYSVDDLSGGYSWRPNLARTELFNGIKGTFISEANQWQQADFPSFAQDQLHGYTNGTPANNYDVNVDNDGHRVWRDVQLPFTTSVSMAQRLAKIELLRIRHQGRGALQGMMSMYKSAPLDVVYMSFDPLNWVNKLLEIANIRLVQRKGQSESGEEVTLLSTEIDVAETDPSIYAWSTTEELSAQGQSYVPGLQNLSPD